MHYEGPHIWSGIILEGAAEMMLKGYGVGNNVAAYYPLSMQEAFARGMASRLNDASETVKLVLLLGEYLHRHYHNRYHSKAQNLRVLLRACLRPGARRTYDMLAMPTIPFTATLIPDADCSREIYVDRALNMQANTCPFDVSGHPAFTIPCGMKDGLPVGLMLVGRHFEESRLIQAAAAFESEETMSSDDLHYLDLVDVARRIKVGALSPVTLDRGHAAADRKARRRAEELRHRDRRYGDEAGARGGSRRSSAARYRGPLHGVPIAVKDLCYTKGIPRRPAWPSTRTSSRTTIRRSCERFAQAGAVLLGKLQLTEGAYADHHPSITPPVNPWHKDHWSGASSSGSGVATAAGLCSASLGSDTGGSIRFPSAANGVTGLKPTWGRVSRYGVFALAEIAGSYRPDDAQRRGCCGASWA